MLTNRRTRLALLLAALSSGCVSLAGQTVRHHKIADTGSSFPPELIQAESDIEKKDYAAAEPLLQKVVTADPKNYQAWFDLGYVYNAQGNLTESIAAYRKSVAAKPDVFESNLNLGISLAKAGQGDAEQYLRAATTLKPTADVNEGQARAWLSLATVLDASKPDEAIAAYQRAAALTPKDLEPHLAAGALLAKGNHFADAEQEYKRALEIDPGSNEALIGLANIYTRGDRFLDAQTVLEKIVALHPDDVQARAVERVGDEHRDREVKERQHERRPSRQQHTESSTGDGDDDAIRKRFSGKLAAAGAHRDANRDLARAGEGAPQQKAGDVGASDEEDCARREAEQHSNHRAALVGFPRQHSQEKNSEQRAVCDRGDLQPNLDHASNLLQCQHRQRKQNHRPEKCC